MASAQEVEKLRRQLDELTAQMIEMRQQSSNTAMNAAVTGLTEAVGQSVSKPRPEDMRVGKPEPYAPGQDFDDWNFTFNEYAGTLDPAYPASQRGARKVVRKAGNNGFEAYRQLCLMYGTSDQEGSTGLFVQIMTTNFWNWSSSRPSKKKRPFFRTRPIL